MSTFNQRYERNMQEKLQALKQSYQTFSDKNIQYNSSESSKDNQPSLASEVIHKTNLVQISTQQILKCNSEKNLRNQNQPKQQKRLTIDFLDKKPFENYLFTITETHYARKSNNAINQKTIKDKYQRNNGNIFRKLSPLDEIETMESTMRDSRKVNFTERLIKDEKDNENERKSQHSWSKSIIKKSTNNVIQDNKSNHSKNSAKFSFASIGESNLQEIKFNDQIKKKYFDTLENLKNAYSKRKNKMGHENQQISKEFKYTDPIFPPVSSSLFIKSQQKMKGNKHATDILWMRIPEIFSAFNLSLTSNNSESNIKILIEQKSLSGDHVGVGMNGIKNNKYILYKMFQDQCINDFGLYLVKIFQQKCWKYVMIDDYIPVREIRWGDSNKRIKYVPAFINVVPTQPKSKILEIWPFLLQKAYAHYYSSYQLLKFGNTLDFTAEIIGLPPTQLIYHKKLQKQFQSLYKELLSNNKFAIAEIQADHKYYAVIETKNDPKTNERVLTISSELSNFSQNILTFSIFGSLLRKVYLFDAACYPNLASSTIGKYLLNNGVKCNERSEITLRQLKVWSSSSCVISLQQKQKRFFSKSSLAYEYMWVRLLLIQRQFDGYRWIDGAYSNEKIISFSLDLEEGEYYLIVMPEWKATNCYELTLLAMSASSITIQNKKENDCERMIEQAAMDLAQRKGKVNQLSSTLCSYNYICSKTGLIIENINNEKLKQDITITRSIDGIRCAVELLPVNKQFYHFEKHSSKGKLKGTIQITIPKLSSFTIVLKMKGGLDQTFFKLFST